MAYALEGKVAVVTGAGSGIGRALAHNLASKGCKLALADIDAAGLQETAAGIDTEVLTQKLDVADRAAVYAFADAVKGRFGTAHVVVNNAGVAVSQTIADLGYQDFEWLMGINFWGVVHGTKAFLPMLLAQDEGAVVNISSVFGLFAWPAQGAYNAAKFAVRGFTECLRIELRDTDVKAISVHPGGIKTNIVRNARVHVDHRGRRDAKALADEFQRLARTTPEKAAQIIVDGIERGRPRVLVGPDAVLMDKIQRLMPESYSGVLLKLSERLSK
ncbi:MAG: SDR family NAD(P)-dependent oxidoreductase [Gammaproteobacteria bacterium]|nr:SDR family NAD(P)-dependent oxidoreductase [Gammaproteobacteria bacterium]